MAYLNHWELEGSASFVPNTSLVRMAGEKCASDDKPDSSEDCGEQTCIFCKIANRDDPSTEILAEVS